MKIVLALVHLLVLFASAYGLSKKWAVTTVGTYWSAFAVRLLAGVSLGLVYSYYYDASDTWQFFAEAKTLSALAREDFSAYANLMIDFSGDRILSLLSTQELRSVFFIKIISVFCLVSLDNYWVCTAYISFLAFVVSWALHRKVTHLFPDARTASSLAFLFFPSVIFWSSGLEKESVALCGLYVMTIAFLSWYDEGRISKLNWILLLPAAWAVWSLKYYWAIIFFIAVLTLLIIRYLGMRSKAIKSHPIIVWMVFFPLIGVLLSVTHPNFYLHRFLEVVVSNHAEFVNHSDPAAVIHYLNLDESWASIAINAPWALVSGLFRPVIGEGRGLLGFFASIENLLLLALFGGALLNLKKATASPHLLLLLAVVSYVVVQCVFLALSTPNFGTLSRYRIGFLPFLVFVLAYGNSLLRRIMKRNE